MQKSFEAMTKIVYALTNPAMPGLVKIGYTSKNDVQSRMDDLFNTSVPLPFSCIKAVTIQDDPKVIEKALHAAFVEQRVNLKREFFKIEPSQVVLLLDALGKKDVTPMSDVEGKQVDAESIKAAKDFGPRRPNLNFNELGIENGETIKAVRFDEYAEVIDQNRVLFRGEKLHLTVATRNLLEIEYSVSGAPHWKYKGRALSEIYDEYHARNK